jgi:hypothetical protein
MLHDAMYFTMQAVVVMTLVAAWVVMIVVPIVAFFAARYFVRHTLLLRRLRLGVVGRYIPNAEAGRLRRGLVEGTLLMESVDQKVREYERVENEYKKSRTSPALPSDWEARR